MKIEMNKKVKSIIAVYAILLFVYAVLFVAIPLPGTGAWVGSLIANFLNLPPKKAIPPIILGVLTAGVIMLAGTAIVDGGLQVLFQRG